MRNFYVIILCLSLLFSQPLVRVSAEEISTSTDSSVSVPSPAPTSSPYRGYDWKDESSRRTSGIFTYQILDESEKKAAIVEVNEKVKNLTIPAALDGYRIVSVGQMEWEEGVQYDWDPSDDVSAELKNTLETLTISEGIQHVGYFAFVNCKKLTTLNLPKNLCCISYAAFGSCTSLKNVHIQKSDSKYGTHIGDRAFGSCTSLECMTLESCFFADEMCLGYARIQTILFPHTDRRDFTLGVNMAEVSQILVDPHVQTLCLVVHWSGSIGKIVVNGKNTTITEFSEGLKFGTLYTVAKAKSISWAKKHKRTYKVKSCGKMGKVARQKKKATWKPVTTTVRTYNYNKQKKKWKTTSRKVKTYYNVYGKNSKNGSYKLIKTTTKTSYTSKYKYLKVEPVATWE